MIAMTEAGLLILIVVVFLFGMFLGYAIGDSAGFRRATKGLRRP